MFGGVNEKNFDDYTPAEQEKDTLYADLNALTHSEVVGVRQNNDIEYIQPVTKKKWKSRVSILVPPACEAGALPFELHSRLVGKAVLFLLYNGRPCTCLGFSDLQSR